MMTTDDTAASGDCAALCDTQDMSIYRTIYGNHSGEWAIIEGPVGLTTPPTLTMGKARHGERTLHQLGSASDLFTRLHRAMQGSRRQQSIADAIGVTQQSVSRFVAGTSEPKLTAEQWSATVVLFFEAMAWITTDPPSNARQVPPAPTS